MKRDDIAQAFHLMAMGRANHPLQVELIDALASLLDKPEPVKPAPPVVEIEMTKRKGK